MQMSDIVPRSQVTSSGVKGVGAAVGGAGLLVLNWLPSLPAIIVGAALLVGGLALSSSKSDRTAGIVTAVAGGLAALSGIIPGLSWLLWVPGLGLLGAGVYSLVKFFRGMKSRT
jgi:hypothetical protein